MTNIDVYTVCFSLFVLMINPSICIHISTLFHWIFQPQASAMTQYLHVDSTVSVELFHLAFLFFSACYQKERVDFVYFSEKKRVRSITNIGTNAEKK